MCKENNCNKFVFLNKYCKKHRCEEKDCKRKKIGTSYCFKHKCIRCENKCDKYGEYCGNHFCAYDNCNENVRYHIYCD